MPIFQIKYKKAIPLKEKSFESERKLQEFIDENIDEFFGLKFIKREFGGQGLSIDTIAYDPETKGPVLIEYKKDTQVSVVDQGIAYLDWLLNHKGDYLVLLEEKLKTKDVNWSQARVIFIAKNYSPHQIRAAGMKGVPFEIWRYDLYENLFNLQIVETPKSDVSLSSIIKTKAAREISKEIKTPTVEDHLKKANDNTKELFEAIREKILSLDDRIIEKPVTWYIGYKVRYFNFVSVHLFKDKIKIHARTKKIDDPKKLFKKVPASYGWGKTPLWYVNIFDSKNLDYYFSIVKQAYESAPDR